MVHNVIIIGSGPAGYTAALYTARADLKPIMFSGLQPGGQLMITTEVENYPGFPDGVQGPEMMKLFEDQVKRFGVEIHMKSVTKVDLSQRPYKVYVDDGEEYVTRSIIVTTGASAKWLGLEGEIVFGGFGVSACATCDGFFFRNKEVIVVGGGDTAMEEANYLTRHASKVYLVHRRQEFRASKIMQDRVLPNPKVEVLYNTVIDEILGDMHPKKVTGVRLRDIVTDQTREMPIGGVFVAIGHKPNSELFQGVLDMDPVGYILVLPGSTKTNLPGVFAAGDVADSIYRQAVTAAGTGCMAAIDAERFLDAEEH
jgi:thioredoxin reductase (NADPH)